MPLDESVVQSVVNANFKAIGEQPALVANAMSMSMQAHNNATNLIREGVLSEALGQRAGHDVSEASATRTISTADLARTIGELSATVAGIQQMMKGAQTTPPQTG
jgi:hypothetical protein